MAEKKSDTEELKRIRAKVNDGHSRCPQPLKWSPTFGDVNTTAVQFEPSPPVATPERLAETDSKLLATVPLMASGDDAIAWHLEQGHDNGKISREALAATLQNQANTLLRLLDLVMTLQVESARLQDDFQRASEGWAEISRSIRERCRQYVDGDALVLEDVVDGAIESLRAERNGLWKICTILDSLDWCIGYSLTESNMKILDKALDSARAAIRDLAALKTEMEK